MELLWPDAGRTVEADYATKPLGANDGTSPLSQTLVPDYVASRGSLTFQPGETVKQVFVSVLGDNDKEFIEGFRLLLSNASGAGISYHSGPNGTGYGPGIGYIENDDGEDPVAHTPGTCSFELNDQRTWGSCMIAHPAGTHLLVLSVTPLSNTGGGFFFLQGPGGGPQGHLSCLSTCVVSKIVQAHEATWWCGGQISWFGTGKKVYVNCMV